MNDEIATHALEKIPGIFILCGTIQHCFPKPSFRLKFTAVMSPNRSGSIAGAQSNVHRGPLCDEKLLGLYISLGVVDGEMERDEAIFSRPEATRVILRKAIYIFQLSNRPTTYCLHTKVTGAKRRRASWHTTSRKGSPFNSL